MAWRIDLAPRARRDIEALSPPVAHRIAEKIDGLAKDPRAPGSRKMVGGTNEYRLRVGDWRIIYEISDERQAVLITRVGHRREVYRD